MSPNGPQTRGEIEDFLRRSPGATSRQIRMTLKIDKKTAYTHLRRLKASGLVRTGPCLTDCRMTRHYLTGGP